MSIEKVNAIDIIPRFMKEDKSIIALCKVMDFFVSKVNEKLPLVNLYENLELLTEEDLDYIAAKDEIDWYDTGYTREQKIRIIKGHERACMFIGSKHSIESVLADIFGFGEEEEWFEYGSEAYKFRIVTSAIMTENTNDLLIKVLRKVKTSKSKLEWTYTKRDTASQVFLSMNETKIIRRPLIS